MVSYPACKNRQHIFHIGVQTDGSWSERQAWYFLCLAYFEFVMTFVFSFVLFWVRPALFDLSFVHFGVFVLQFTVSKAINIIVCVETVQQARCRRLLVYRAIPAVCVCLCDGTQVSDNGVSFSFSLHSFFLSRSLSLSFPCSCFCSAWFTFHPKC